VKSETKAPPERSDRLLAALLAPLAFNACILIVLLVFLRSTALAVVQLVSGPIFIVLVAVPAAVGYAAGTDGFVRFLGHSFYTHGEDERNLGMTLAIWAAIIAVAWLLSLSVAWG
jgi:hypothetical protein